MELRKKICYVLPEFREETESHFSYLYDFINVVARDADIFLVVERGSPPPSRFKSVSYLRKMHVRFLPLRIIEEFFVMIRARSLGYRIFYTHYSYAGAILSSSVARLFGGVSYYWNCGMPWLYGKQMPLRLVLLVVHRLVTGTATMRALYAKEYGLPLGKIVVLPNWIDLATFVGSGEKTTVRKKLGLPKDRKIVFFAHRLSRRKGADKIIRIASAIADPSALFVVAGDGPLLQDIKDDVIKNNLEKSVTVLGKIPHTEIASYFFAADVFIMPSEEEGFPHVLLEAMTAGLPFVATNIGGVRDIVPVALQKYCVKEDDVHGFVDRLSELLESRDGRASIALLEKEHVKKYDQATVARQFLGLF